MAYCSKCGSFYCNALTCVPTYLPHKSLVPDPIISRHFRDTGSLVTPGYDMGRPIADRSIQPNHGDLGGPMMNQLLK